MMQSDLIKNLGKLKEIKPSSQWQERNRVILLSKIAESAPAEAAPFEKQAKRENWLAQFTAAWQIFVPRQMALAARTVAVSAIIALVIFEGGIFTVNASKDTLPGDAFYSVKMAVERAQIAVTAGNENKAKLGMEFAGRRVEELDKVVKQEDGKTVKKEKVQAAVKNFKKNITVANDHLNKLNEQKETAKAVEVAKIMENKSKEYEKSLSEAKVEIAAEKAQGNVDAQEMSSNLDDAIDSVEESGYQAVEVIIEKVSQGEAEMEDQDLLKMVEEKVIKTEGKVQAAEEKLRGLEVTNVAPRLGSLGTESLGTRSGQAEGAEAAEEAVAESAVNEGVIEVEMETSGEIVETSEITTEEIARTRQEESVSSAKKAVDQQAEAQKVLAEVKQLLEENKIQEAFAKLRTVKEQTKEVVALTDLAIEKANVVEPAVMEETVEAEEQEAEDKAVDVIIEVD